MLETRKSVPNPENFYTIDTKKNGLGGLSGSLTRWEDGVVYADSEGREWRIPFRVMCALADMLPALREQIWEMQSGDLQWMPEITFKSEPMP